MARRELARAAVMEAICDEARRQLARDGAAALSLRSIAREVGMVSSAVYRYVASRDELLTLLIVDAYSSLADGVEGDLEGAPHRHGRAGWRAACRAVRGWALEHRHEYALLYGSPVPGYAAPHDTIGPATRVYAALLSTVTPALHPVGPARLPRSIRADAERVAVDLGLDADPAQVATALGAIASVFGLVSFELFGHTHGVITDSEAFFTLRIDGLAAELGLT